MRPTLLRELRQIYPVVVETFGYETKYTRQQHGIEKSHVNDARCISGNPIAKPCHTLKSQFVRVHNRQMHKMKTIKGGVRRMNQAPKYVFGFKLFDKVLFDGQVCFIFARRQSGRFDLRLLDGEKVNASVTCKKIKLIEHSTANLFQ